MLTEQIATTDLDKPGVALNFGESFTIQDVATWKERLARAFIGAADVCLDLSKTDSVDSAALQLLLAYIQAAKSRGLRIHWQTPSAAFLRAVTLTGIRSELEL